MLKIDNDVPIPEEETTKTLRREFVDDIAPKMEVGDSIFAERSLETANIWIRWAGRRDSTRDFGFTARKESGGIRIWRTY